MGQAQLTWNPNTNGNSTGQKAQYKPHSDSTWIDGPTVGPSVNNVNIVANFLENIAYDFRVLNICASGGPTPSASKVKAIVPCVEYVLDYSYDTHVDIKFVHVGGDVNHYLFRLYDATQTNIVGTQEFTGPFTPGQELMAHFTDLESNSDYYGKIQVSIKFTDGTPDIVNTGCPFGTLIQTAPPPECTAPTNVEATITL